MAVKQNNTETSTTPAVGSSTQNVNQSTGVKKDLNLAVILKFIDFVNTRQEECEIPSDELISLSRSVVIHLAKVSVPREPQALKQYKEDIGKVYEFLSKPGDKSNYVPYLQIVYRLITDSDQPSAAIAIVFQLFSEDLIEKAVSIILTSGEYASDENIRRAVNVLCSWLRIYPYFQSLNLWILAILNGLREQEKYPLLYDIAIDVIEPLFFALVIPILRPKIFPVVHTILASVKHTPAVFHKIIGKAPKIVKQLKQDSERSENDKKILQSMVDLLSALLVQFQTPAELCKEVEEALLELTPSYDYRSTLDLRSYNDLSLFAGQSEQTNVKVGLVNLGNTCYMNSVLQALAMTKEFRREILLTDSNSPTFRKIQELIALMLHSSRPELTPSSVLHATRPPGFVCGLQQDSSEFLGYLLEMLHEQENRSGNNSLRNDATVSDANDEDEESAAAAASSSSPKVKLNAARVTAIEKTFAGRTTTTYRCLSCNWESKNTDSFRDLQLSFPDMKNDCASNYSVQDLLDYYCSPEKLDGDNQYFCEKCKKLTDAQRLINIVNPPKNLILTLKHFKYDQKYHMRAKLMHKVYHDENISLKVCSSKSRNEQDLFHYNLYAAVVHSGFSMDSGHYYTYATDDNEQWYKFNDNIVTVCSISELHNLNPPNTPYILFYQMNSRSSETSGTNCRNNSELASSDSDDSDSFVKNRKPSAATNFVRVEVPNLPKLDELVPHLRDYIRKDNHLYEEEVRTRRIRASQTQKTNLGLCYPPKNKGGGPGNNNDDEDEPPSSCGGNNVNYFNKFVY